MPSGRGTMRRTPQPGPFPARSRLFTGPNSTPSWSPWRVFRGDVEIVSDCKGVVDEAERIRSGGRGGPYLQARRPLG